MQKEYFVSLEKRVEQKIREVICNSSELKEFLKFYRKYFREYSPRNRILIYAQNKLASYVAGFHAWKKLGYHVKKGAKAITIIAPKKGKDESIYGYFALKVFDNTQVEAGENALPLPIIDMDLEDSNQSIYPIQEVFHETKKFIEEKIQREIIIEELPHTLYNGKTNGKMIYIRKREIPAMLGTLIHEYVHYQNHFGIEDKANENQQEVEAELGTILFGNLFQFNTEKAYLYLATHKEGVSFQKAFEKILPFIDTLAQEIGKRLSIKIPLSCDISSF